MDILEKANNLVWGVPTLILIIGTGIIFTVCTRLSQLQLLPRALRSLLGGLFSKKGTLENTSFRALCTALGATVGTGNLAGVAGAIAIGGPGAIFWIWVCGFLGMVVKFAEAVLAVHYRVRGNDGAYSGGPMYVIAKGLPKRFHFLATIYSMFGVVAAFGVGNATQINALIGSVNSVRSYFGGIPTDRDNLIMGIMLAVLVVMLLSGGAKRIGKAAEALVPFASVLYILLGIGIVILKHEAIPGAFTSIMVGAFSPKAVTGGAIGSFFVVLRIGTSRGVFTHEAGMGTAGIAHADAKVRHPVQQGLMGIVEVFLDTIVICTITAFAILCSGIGIDYGTDVGIFLTIEAFSSVYGGWITILLSAAIFCFALATVLGWGLYGARCAQFLFGEGVWKYFVVLQAGGVILGATMQTGAVFMLCEIMNGLMALPNLIALNMLLPQVCRLLREYNAIYSRKSRNPLTKTGV